MNKYLEAEKQLAELFGWMDVKTGQYTGWINTDVNTLTGKHPNGCQGRPLVPRWTQNDGEAFKLMVEYDIDTMFIDDEVQCYFTAMKRISAYVEDHPDKAAAVRYAIVQATIQKLRSIQ